MSRLLGGECYVEFSCEVPIADAARALGIAGILGGEDSEIRPTTTRIALEAANFEPRGIDRTAQKLGLSQQSAASARFRLNLSPELVPLALRHGLALLPWSPLGGGILTGKYRSTTKPPKGSRADRLPAAQDRLTKAALAVTKAVGELADERGLTSGQLALLWLRDRPGVTSPIVGPRTVEHLQESLAIADHAPLDDEAIAALDEVVAPGTFVSNFHNTSGWMAGASSFFTR